jgi:hypothetical protein
VAGAECGFDAFGDLTRGLGHAVRVLRAAVRAVRAPAAQGDVAEIDVSGESGVA